MTGGAEGRAGRPGRRTWAAAILTALLLQAPPAPAGVRFGDAVPAIIHASDLDRIRRALRLPRFSVIAAVRLGAAEGREAVIVEPLADGVLARLVAGCEAGGVCPDPVGFVAARVRIVVLRDADVETRVVADRAIRDGRGRLIDPDLGPFEGPFLGYLGRAEAASGHVALLLESLHGAGGEDAEGAAAPIETGAPAEIAWDDAAGRFRVRS